MDKIKLSGIFEEINKILKESESSLTELDGFVASDSSVEIHHLMGAFSTYYHFVEKMEIPMLTVDSSAEILFANRAAERFLATSYFNLLTTSFLPFILNKNEREKFKSSLELMASVSDGFNFEVNTKEEKRIPVMCYTYPLKIDKLQVFGVVLIDISRHEELKKLADKERLIRAVLENNNSLDILVDQDGKILFACRRLTELCRENMEGKFLENALTFYEGDPADPDSLSNDIPDNSLTLAGEIINRLLIARFCSGRKIWGLVNRTLLEEFESTDSKWVIHITDVTDTIKQNKLLSQMEGKYEALIKSMSDLVFTVSRDMKFTGVYGKNPGQYNIKPEQWLGRHLSEVFDESDASIHRSYIEIALNGKPTFYEWSVDNKFYTGHFQISLSPIFDSNENVEGLVGVARDISHLEQLQKRIDEKEQRYRLLFDNSPQAIVLVKNGKLVLWNQKFNELVNANEREVLADYEIKNIFVSLDGKKQFNLDEMRTPEQSIFQKEIKIKTFKGSRKDVRLSGSKIIEDNEEYWQIILSDITREKRLARVKELQQKVTNWIFERKPLPDLCRLIRKELNKIIPVPNLYLAEFNRIKNRLEFIYLQDEIDEFQYVDATGTMSKYTIESGEIQLFQSEDIERMVAEGHYDIVGTKPVSWLGAPLLLQEKNPFILVIQSYDPDIIYTNEDVDLIAFLQQNIELVIRENIFIHNMQQYEFFIDKGPLSVIITNKDGDITYVNQRFTEVTGFTATESIGKNPRFLQSGMTPAETYESLWSTITAGKIWMGEMINRSKNGDIFCEKAVIGPISNEKGDIVNYMGIKEDITEQKQMEHNFLQTQKMESIGTLVGGIAHDFNNMLTAINGYAEMALMRLGKNHPLHKYISSIADAGKTAQEITNQLLAFSRKQIHQPKTIHMNNLLEQHKKMLQRLIPESIRLEFIISDHEIIIWGDPVQLEQVLINLVVNARDAIEAQANADKKLITIEINKVELDESYKEKHPGSEIGQFCCMAVSDTGCGMPDDVRAKIFEPFFTTKEPGKGTGLGLSTVFGIIKQNNGFIYVYSEVNKGTTFKIYWPLYSGPVEEDESEKTVELPTGGERILVVEDQETVRKFAEESLQELGYTVTTAASGEDALNQFGESMLNFDLLITDMVLPGMDGKTLSEKLLQINPNLKVLYTSGYTDNHIVKAGVLDADIHFLQKPYTINTLGLRVREVLEK